MESVKAIHPFSWAPVVFPVWDLKWACGTLNWGLPIMLCTCYVII